jgi:signal transduction histidine kinase
MPEATEPRLLIVGDAPSSSASLESMLSPLGVRLVVASPDQALRLASSDDIAAIVVDAAAPSTGHVEAANWFRAGKLGRRVPLFFLTRVSNGPYEQLQGYTHDGIEYLRMPIDQHALLAKLSPAIELFQIRELLKQKMRLLQEKEELYLSELNARGRAELAMRARDEVLAIVSHDLRNPLSTILASSSMIAKKVGPEVRKQVEMIERSVARMQKLVSDLLEEVRIEAGQLGLDRREHDALVFASQAVEAMKPVAELKSQTLTCELGREPCRVLCDLERVFQVLSNLIGNAVNFTPPGGHIGLSLERGEDEVRFSVKDDGPGIPADQAANIFNRYWQANYTRRKGIGLGLSIAKGIIQAHGGRIWVESELGLGTTFHFTLPRAPAP